MEIKTIYWNKLLARASKLAERVKKDPDACTLRISNLILEMANEINNGKVGK